MHRNSFCARNSTQYSGISYQNVQPYDVIEQEHDTKPDENMLKHSGTNSSNRSFLMNELVQCTEAPSCDNVFICFGQFHILMTY
ncbi:hypothetical protein LSH36_2190g00031, partial [Paralvinella palmiformis]